MIVVAPPAELQRRAWECAYVLREEHADDLPIDQRIYVEVVYRTPYEGLGWHEIARMFVIFGEVVCVRA